MLKKSGGQALLDQLKHAKLEEFESPDKIGEAEAATVAQVNQGSGNENEGE